MIELKPAFRQRMVDVFGDAGRDWLERLPSIIDEYGERWELRIAPPLAQS